MRGFHRHPGGPFAHAASFLIAIIFSLALAQPSLGAYTDAKSKYKEIKRQIEDKQEKLEEAAKLETATLSHIHLANRKLQKVRSNLNRYRSLMEEALIEIERAKLEIADLEKGISRKRNWLRRKLLAMQRFGKHGDLLLAVGAADDIAGAMRRWKYLEALSANEHKALEQYKADLAVLKRKKDKLTTMLDRYKEQEKKVQKSELSLEREMGRKELLLASVRKDKVTYTRLLRELRKASARMQKIIRQSEQRRSSQYKGSDFRRFKGKLPWPVLGNVAIPYGSQKDPRFNTPVFRNGIYIDAEEEAITTSVHGGKVVFADWFEGYGQLVIVNHGSGYHSLYGNLDEIFLRTGDIISKDAAVGKVGTSGITENPSLYFEIRYKGKPLNPSQWLKR
ncbi:MAG: peptidoglycan DD-metalloendopeptidase family protein [Thermodesulfovibrionales bacterium]|nr:peptidoglycan DD-metalloendopeptidase family protein [Thermodesulfovibrionales bacterium]